MDSLLLASIMLIFLLIIIFLRVDVAFALGIISLFWIIINDDPINIVASQAFTGMDQFVLIAIPFFLLLGDLLNTSGVTSKLIKVANMTVGRIRGGLAQANVFTSLLFAGISGAAVADVAALGKIFIPSMEQQGYPRDFSAAVTAASSLVGPIIPPSIILVIYGGVTQTSVGALFVAAIIPGIILTINLMVLVYVLSVKNDYPTYDNTVSRSEYPNIALESLLALTIPILILFLIVGGYATPTEAAAVSCLWAIIIGMFIYKSLSLEDIYESLQDSLMRTAQLYIIIGFALVLTWILARERIPQLLADTIVSLGLGPTEFMILVVLILLIIGTFLEIGAAAIMLAPTLAQISSELGIHELQFGLVFVLAICYGLITPPVGICLFAASGVSDTPVWDISKKIVPFFIVNVGSLLLVIVFSDLTLYLPRLFNII